MARVRVANLGSIVSSFQRQNLRRILYKDKEFQREMEEEEMRTLAQFAAAEA
jgi:hypothetical protein